MKQTLFIRTILSSLAAVACLSCNTAFAGIHLEYPGSSLNADGNLFPGASYSDNTVSITGGEIGGDVYGGYSNSGDITSNTITITGGKIGGNVYGGYSYKSNVTDNTVSITGGEIGENVYGGFSMDANVTGNTVTITGGESSKSVYGGLSYLGEASGNTVTISAGEIREDVYGSFSSFDGDVTGNRVSITGGTIGGDVCGGSSMDGNITGNRVSITGGAIGGDINGGYSNSGDATGNSVTISGGKIRGYVYGGNALNLGNTTRNSITITGGEFGNFVYGGLSADGAATGNTVSISGGAIRGSVYGGFSYKADVTGNTVTISGGEFGRQVYGGYSNEGDAAGNTVTILGGSILYDVYGGFSNSRDATGNTVSISDGEIGRNVYGGYSNEGDATNNTVILGTGANLTETSSVYGGSNWSGTGDAFTGNRLVLNGFHGTVAQISNFEYIDITTSGKQEDMLVIAGGEATDLTNVKLNITFSGMDRPAQVGDSIYLIRNDKGIITTNMTLNQNGQQKVKGTAYIYGIEFGADQTTIHATVTGRKFNDRSKALAEGRVASMAHLNMGGDLIAEQGMDQALRSGREMAKVGKKINLFAAMSATSSRYDTGSHIDLYGYSALAGAAITPPALTSLNAGLFAESGWGHYGSMSDFDDGAVRGAGRSKYYGGGLMAQYDFTQMGASGLSVDASFRAGKADTSFTSGELPDSHYDLSAPYYGIHTGINYTRKLTAKLNMANYARFFWTHLDGDDAPIDGSDFSFRTMDSQRIKAGTRFLYQACSCLTPYAGASYEWECSGTARAIVDGENGMAAPSLRGGTGTGELGAIYQPMSDRPFWVDLSVQGHVGERRGISGGVRVRAEF